jgi:hypothetical protein
MAYRVGFYTQLWQFNDITTLEDIKLLVDTFYSKVQKTTWSVLYSMKKI